MDSPKVSVVKYPDRPHLMLRWKDPLTGKVRSKSAGTSKRRDAERAASKLEREIADGQHGPAARMSWKEFRHYHETHCLRALADKTQDAYTCALTVYQRFANPERLGDVTAARVTAWQTQLRTEGKADATIACYSRHLKATLRWAHSQGLLAVVPKLPAVKRVKSGKVMKGRPITAEEFDRMLAVVPKLVGDDAAPSWERYLRGLWWSGLRLSESLTLQWDSTPGALVVDLTGRRPMLRIPAECEKGNQDRLLPIAPEFAEFLLTTPPAERIGRVFKPEGKRFGNARMLADWVSRVICRVGELARVVVDQRERRLVVDSRKAKAKPAEPGKPKPRKRRPAGDDAIKLKFASAHDLRRAFGLRWSARLMPAVLQQLMRHESIETTMRYYVGKDADSVADALWAAMEKVTPGEKSNKTGNKRPVADSAGAKKKPQTLVS